MNLEKVGIVPGLKYECIYTTISKDKQKNAAPIGFVYLGDGKVKCNLFDGTNTLENIKETMTYVVNITQDPLTFAYATISNVPTNYYTRDEEIAILNDAPSYLIVDVCEIKKHSTQYEVTGKIREFIINNKNVKAFNRGMGCLIDSLVNYTRYNIADEKTKTYFDERLEENQRIINKVSDSKTIKAIELLKKNQEK